MRSFDAFIVLADISGYTEFVVLNRSSFIHAEQIITELMEVVTANAIHPLRLEKLEGDAAFLIAEVTPGAKDAADGIMQQVVTLMHLYRAKQVTLFNRSIGGCACSACQSIERLNLKCVVHRGEVLEKRVGGGLELAGEAVILSHRLMKNSVAEDCYILTTRQLAQQLSVPPFPHRKYYEETVEHLGHIKTTAFFPEAPVMDRGGVRPLTRPSGIFEAARLFAKAAFGRDNSATGDFRKLPKASR